MHKPSLLITLATVLASAQLIVPDSISTSDCPCYKSTTTVVHPTCTPWAGICPMILCASPTATVTKTVPGNANALTRCKNKNVPTVTAYSPCTTDCAPITCPTATATVTGKEKQCCTIW